MPTRVEAEIRAMVDWDKLMNQMNSNESCTKIHGTQLDLFRPGEVWYDSLIKTESHSIFVIERSDRENQMLSYLLARRHGFYKDAQDQLPMYSSMVTMPELAFLRYLIQCHLRFYPTYGEVVTYDTLPEPYFDRNIDLSHRNQNSELRHNCLLNLEYCKEVIADQLAYYKEEWDDKIRSIRPNKQ